jgi:hypothetical protein
MKRAVDLEREKLVSTPKPIAELRRARRRIWIFIIVG